MQESRSLIGPGGPGDVERCPGSPRIRGGDIKQAEGQAPEALSTDTLDPDPRTSPPSQNNKFPPADEEIQTDNPSTYQNENLPTRPRDPISFTRFVLYLLIANTLFTAAFGPYYGPKALETALHMLASRPSLFSTSGAGGIFDSQHSRNRKSLRITRLFLTIVTAVFLLAFVHPIFPNLKITTPFLAYRELMTPSWLTPSPCNNSSLSKLFSVLVEENAPKFDVSVSTVARLWGLNDSSIFTRDDLTPTRDVIPRPVHSHNDYWRQVPLFSALTIGATGVEADVWRYDNALYVGHDAASLNRERTFKSLYIDPIRQLLDRMNNASSTAFIPTLDLRDNRSSPPPFRGVFESDPLQTLNLFIDLKTPGTETLPVVLSHLEPLRTPRNFLTHFNGTHVNRGPITVHLTGDTPFNLMITNTTYRDYFYDAPVMELSSGKFNSNNSLMSSTPFGRDVGQVVWGSGGVTERMKEKIREQVKAAHDRGIGIRYWSTPVWPIGVRNGVWKVLVDEGVDLLNADDIKSAVMMAW